ncbi:Uma2 family endonuclease [Chondromyces apiculatus]|uniref:Putative restriction endonuclease domain-containing protein n=1 Tax=Chondromyces apiculatus DSM 436 TaxID=1192034 RepID=A0A017SXZ8_9BACT|nr:Uma2 family endonuclease [Chondromyces apiculatus]EYF01485.1 Hypothetical protein CAP_8046 [Chondromyces apiculatus DSM 436]
MSHPGRKLPGKFATVEELLALPEEERYEILDGELVRKEAASGRHGGVQWNVGVSLGGPFGRRSSGGPPNKPGGWWFATETLIQFGPGQVYRPDAAGWRRERLAALPAEVPITTCPDWVCEVLSPSNASTDTVKKMWGYHRAEVAHYWLLDPRDETLKVYRWTAEGYLLRLSASREERVRAEPFEAIEIAVGTLFGVDEG